ncbi:ComF family protein [Brachyspira murdochii]|uniref:ComFC, predicted amidophosphoribosyltransferase n=2 Tax=Brachyspira murdochii TaxID=84378 RepID=D5U6F9_BRAM5|nr:phosphoribosyltransferase family protein [Brachyspira murdochii]ADG72658.1 ComFC, predicted amidophosphoribosyltransferase [Brachyspira murdochii DSM 12563]PPS22181.1 amidophosphoribosyltransferase [Brachyspira murdochii]
MNNFNPYKVFYIDDIKVTALGDLDKELGDEIRALKKKEIDIPYNIFNCIDDYIKANDNKFDILIYIPSNKSSGIMNYFSDYISDKFDIAKYDLIKIIKNIKEQKYLESLKERKDNIKNAFEMEESLILINKNILLIDDVYASGETLKEVIKLFKALNFNYYLECLIFCYRNHFFS